jgi:hypothetical protein
MKAYAYMQQNVWKVKCPKGCDGSAVLAEPNANISPHWAINGEYICPCEYPKAIAYNRRIVGGIVAPMLDLGAYKTAKVMASEHDEVFEVVFPENRADIEKVLHERPVQYRSWYPGETIEMLEAENVELEKAGKLVLLR